MVNPSPRLSGTSCLSYPQIAENIPVNLRIIAANNLYIYRLQGKISGQMNALGFSMKEEATLTTVTLDVVKSSEIKGEQLNYEQVRSSIARHLGMNVAGLVPSDRNIEGVVEMMLDATQNYLKPLTEEWLFGWHSALFPTGHSGIYKI